MHLNYEMNIRSELFDFFGGEELVILHRFSTGKNIYLVYKACSKFFLLTSFLFYFKIIYCFANQNVLKVCQKTAPNI